jgi:hypothetical protein
MEGIFNAHSFPSLSATSSFQSTYLFCPCTQSFSLLVPPRSFAFVPPYGKAYLRQTGNEQAFSQFPGHHRNPWAYQAGMPLCSKVPPVDMRRHDSVRPYNLYSDHAGVFVCCVAMHRAVIWKHLHAEYPCLLVLSVIFFLKLA